MTGTAEKWAERIAAWHESGLTSNKFCEGREFSANGLRHWAHKLGQTKRRRQEASMRIARVVPVPAPVPPTRAASAPGPADSPIAVEIGGARIVVRAGFDRETLEALIDVLAAGGSGR